MKKEYTELDIEKIDIKRSLRKDNGNLDALTASVRKHGLLCPIIVDRNHVLISGGRRLAACRRAGMTTVPVIRTPIEYKEAEALALQADDNLCRLPLSADELDALIRLKTSAAGSARNGVLGGFKRLFHND